MGKGAKFRYVEDFTPLRRKPGAQQGESETSQNRYILVDLERLAHGSCAFNGPRDIGFGNRRHRRPLSRTRGLSEHPRNATLRTPHIWRRRRTYGRSGRSRVGPCR
jgi:hypothetical protein